MQVIDCADFPTLLPPYCAAVDIRCKCLAVSPCQCTNPKTGKLEVSKFQPITIPPPWYPQNNALCCGCKQQPKCPKKTTPCIF